MCFCHNTNCLFRHDTNLYPKHNFQFLSCGRKTQQTIKWIIKEDILLGRSHKNFKFLTLPLDIRDK